MKYAGRQAAQSTTLFRRFYTGSVMAKLRRFLRCFLCEQYIRSHGVLRTAYNVVAGVEEETVLEHEHAATFGHNIEPPLHVIRVEGGGAPFERLLTLFAFGIIQIQVQRKVRPLFAIRCFIRAVAMCCADQQLPAINT